VRAGSPDRLALLPASVTEREGFSRAVAYSDALLG